MGQGTAQDLLGCEMAAEIGHLDYIVYGIVTNHVQWNFWRRLNEKIELEQRSLNLMSGDATKAYFGKIYAMLSDE